MGKDSTETVVPLNPVMVPVTWLIGILGSGLFGAFCIGVWVAGISGDVQGQAEEIVASKKKITKIERDMLAMRLNAERAATILAIKFPDAASEAMKRVPATEPEESAE